MMQACRASAEEVPLNSLQILHSHTVIACVQIDTDCGNISHKLHQLMGKQDMTGQKQVKLTVYEITHPSSCKRTPSENRNASANTTTVEHKRRGLHLPASIFLQLLRIGRLCKTPAPARLALTFVIHIGQYAYASTPSKSSSLISCTYTSPQNPSDSFLCISIVLCIIIVLCLRAPHDASILIIHGIIITKCSLSQNEPVRHFLSSPKGAYDEIGGACVFWCGYC